MYIQHKMDYQQILFYSIVADHNKNLWISTRNGISKIVLTASGHSFKNYGIEHGLEWLEYNAGAAGMDSDGNIYFGSFKGLTEFDPKKIFDKKEKGQIFLTGLNLSGNKYELCKPLINEENDSIYLNRSSILKFKQDQTTFTLTFADLDYSNINQKESFQGYLLNENKDTIPLSFEGNTVTFNNLERGSYDLHVFSQGEMSGKIDHFESNITIPKKFYEEPENQIPIALLIMICGYGLIYYYINKKKRNRESKIYFR